MPFIRILWFSYKLHPEWSINHCCICSLLLQHMKAICSHIQWTLSLSWGLPQYKESRYQGGGSQKLLCQVIQSPNRHKMSYSLLISDGKLPVSGWFKNNPKQQQKMSLWYFKFLSIKSPRLLSLFWSSSSLIIIKATQKAFIKNHCRTCKGARKWMCFSKWSYQTEWDMASVTNRCNTLL